MKFFKGTVAKLEFHYLDEDLQAKDMSGYSFALIGKQDKNQPTAEFNITSGFDTTYISDGLLFLMLSTTDIDTNYYICQCVATKASEADVVSDIFSIEIMESLL